MDSRLVLEEVRRALDIKNSVENNRAVGTPDPLFVELGGYVQDIFPKVQDIYDSLGKIQRIWLSNGVDPLLASLQLGDIPLGQGTLTVQDFLNLERLFQSLKAWFEQPVVLERDTEGQTPGPIPLVVISQRPR